MVETIVNSEEFSPDKSDLVKIKKLLVKVKELADRGFEGERISAQKLLEKLLNKYGLKEKEITSENAEIRMFRVVNKDDCVTVLSQTIFDILPTAKVKMHNRKLEIYCKLTSEQYIDVSEKFEFYWKLWCKEKSQFLTAFIVKNCLGTNNTASTEKKLDKETIAGVRKKLNGITKVNFIGVRKKLNGI